MNASRLKHPGLARALAILIELALEDEKAPTETAGTKTKKINRESKPAGGVSHEDTE